MIFYWLCATTDSLVRSFLLPSASRSKRRVAIYLNLAIIINWWGCLRFFVLSCSALYMQEEGEQNWERSSTLWTVTVRMLRAFVKLPIAIKINLRVMIGWRGGGRLPSSIDHNYSRDPRDYPRTAYQCTCLHVSEIVLVIKKAVPGPTAKRGKSQQVQQSNKNQL